jgi:hypothetical protein
MNESVRPHRQSMAQLGGKVNAKSNKWMMSRRGFLGATASATALAALGWSAESPAAMAAPLGDPPALTLPEPALDGISRAQIFDYNIPDPSVYDGNEFYYIWGTSFSPDRQPIPASKYFCVIRFTLDYTLDWFAENHPDWVLYKDDRTTPALYLNDANVTFDFTNPEAREFYFSTVMMPVISQGGFPIVALDNMAVHNTPRAAGHYDLDGNWVQLFSGENIDDVFGAAILDWLSYAVDRFHQEGVAVAANISTDPTHDLTQSIAAINLVDIYVDESGFTRGGDIGEYNDDMWANKFAMLRGVVADKLWVSINYVKGGELSAASPQQVNYAIGCYMLCREQKSMLAMARAGSFEDEPKLHTNIGVPVEAPAQVASGAWRRAYQHGLVFVNPTSSQTQEVDVPAGTWHDLDGQEIVGPTTLSLPPVTASVLAYGPLLDRSRRRVA